MLDEPQYSFVLCLRAMLTLLPSDQIQPEEVRTTRTTHKHYTDVQCSNAIQTGSIRCGEYAGDLDMTPTFHKEREKPTTLKLGGI